METAERVLTKISTGPGIHSYFDTNPESPDGTMVTWFEFSGKPLTGGSVVLAKRDGKEPVKVLQCNGCAHVGAWQGWLDNDHIYFSTGGNIYVADRTGKIVSQCPGSVDTIHQGTGQGLTHSAGIKNTGGTPSKPEACYKINVRTGKVAELLDFPDAWAVLAENEDLAGVPEHTMSFKHTKWAPDGSQWLVVFTNEGYRKKVDASIPRIKVLLAADADGNNLRYIGPFGHHPNWMPDSSGIYAFAEGGRHQLILYPPEGGEASVLAEMPCEAHPCVSPDQNHISVDGYHQVRPDSVSVYLQDRVTGASELLTTLDWPQAPWQEGHPPARLCHAHPVWSADGKRLYFNGTEEGMPALYCIEIE